MAGKLTDPKQVSKILNEFVKNINKCEFTQLLKIFKEKKVPYAQQTITEFIKRGYLVKTDGKYSWVKEQPLYFEELNNIFKKSRETRYSYNAHKTTEEEAIQVLKKLGYKLYKPTIQYDEI